VGFWIGTGPLHNCLHFTFTWGYVGYGFFCPFDCTMEPFQFSFIIIYPSPHKKHCSHQPFWVV